jgi:hypothetical protein
VDIIFCLFDIGHLKCSFLIPQKTYFLEWETKIFETCVFLQNGNRNETAFLSETCAEREFWSCMANLVDPICVCQTAQSYFSLYRAILLGFGNGFVPYFNLLEFVACFRNCFEVNVFVFIFIKI